MEALSRREEQEIEAAAKTDALKACDDYVRGEWRGSLLVVQAANEASVCQVLRRAHVHAAFCVCRAVQDYERMHQGGVSGSGRGRGREGRRG